MNSHNQSFLRHFHELPTSTGETSELTICAFLLLQALFFPSLSDRPWWMGLEPRGAHVASGVPGTLGATYVACSCGEKVIRVILPLITWVNLSNIWALKHHHFPHSPHGQFRKKKKVVIKDHCPRKNDDENWKARFPDVLRSHVNLTLHQSNSDS